jgi:hypothetical protein
VIFRIVLFASLLFPASAFAQAGPCPGLGEVVINELSYKPTDGSFVELWGPPGASLSCLQLVASNGGDGTSCTTSSVIVFSNSPDPETGQEQVFGEDGLFVMAHSAGETIDLVTSKSDLQNGPDALTLIDVETELVLDTVAYGAPLDACETQANEGASFAPEHPDGASIGRFVDGQDTNENGSDWVVCPNPTPGGANTCPEPVVCGEIPQVIAINELQLGPTGEEFVELLGAPGALLDCYALRNRNGGSDGDLCKVEDVTPLAGMALNEEGYLAVFMDLQKGPDAVELVFETSTGTELMVDSVLWKSQLPACPDDVGAGNPAPVPENGVSLSRCWDTGNDAADFVLGEPSPGAENLSCPEGVDPVACDDLPTVAPKINEIQTSTGDAAFIELYGEPGTPLSCMVLLRHNGGSDGDKCDQDGSIELPGRTIGNTGHFLIAKDGGDHTEYADVLHPSADLQDGPDGLTLIYVQTSGEVTVLDSIVYGGDPLPACDESIGEGETAKKAKSGKSLTRCPDEVTGMPIDYDDNATDFKLCATPSPRTVTACTCGAPDPASGGSVKIDDGGCHHSGSLPLGFGFFLLGSVFFIAQRRESLR